MPIAVHPPETDLLIPLPGPGETWDPHTIHTHYFGFSVPEARIGGFLYIRYQPAFPLCAGGVVVFRGSDALTPLDAAFMDYQVTMPYPELDGNVVQTANGLRIEFLEPGRAARVSFTSRDGSVALDLEQTAVTPLIRRGHVLPGEEDHHDDPGAAPGGTEQFMHVTGTLDLRGETFAVDCFSPRDRSWRQVRAETQGGAQPVPPVCWSPMYFGPDLAFNQVSFEHPDTNPTWAGLYDLPPDKIHYSSWVFDGEETLEIAEVRRRVLEHHPLTYGALRQTIEATDERGGTYRFEGEAVASSPIPAWPNLVFVDAVYRWEDAEGRVTHSSCQEGWTDAYQRHMTARRAGA